MRFPGFIGGSYQSQSLLLDAEETINWYPEVAESSSAVNRLALYPTPGFTPYVTVTDVGTRALLDVGGSRCFAVVGPTLYELFANKGVPINRGTVGQDSNPATISYNGVAGSQLFITSAGNGFVYNLNTNAAPTQVLTGDATMGAMKDGFFLAFNLVTGRVRLSNLNDGATWDPTQFFARSLQPDPWQAMVIGPDFNIWLIGEVSGEVWTNVGSAPQPFAPYLNAVFKYGTVSPFGVTTAGNQVLWPARNQDGAATVVAAQGYSPQKVSTYAVDTAMAAYARGSRITDAEGFAYQDQGHLFYVLSFQSANKTWCFDTQQPGFPIISAEKGAPGWHKRARWNSRTSTDDLWRPRVHCYAFGQHLVGDRTTNIISTMDVTVGTEADGSVIRRVRRAPALLQEMHRLPHNRLELLLETGLGLNSGQGSAPLITMRMSNDGGRTYNNEHSASVGSMGQYRQQVYWNRLGLPRDRVYEVVATDPIPYRIVDAFLNNSDGQGPGQ